MLGYFLLLCLDPCDENGVATLNFCFLIFSSALVLGLELVAVVTQICVFSAPFQGAWDLVLIVT